MKDPFFERVVQNYRVHRNWPKFHPRKVTPPADYYPPSYFSTIACVHSDSPLCPLEERCVDIGLANAQVPTYFLDGNFLQAILTTDLKDKPKLQDLHLPLNDMLLMLPLSLASKHFFGFRVPYIGYTTAHVKEHPTAKMFVFAFPVFPSDSKPFGYWGRIPMHENIDDLSDYKMNDQSELEGSYAKWAMGDEDYEIHSPGVEQPTPEQDVKLPDRAFEILYKLLLVLNTQHSTHLITKGTKLSSGKIGRKTGQIIRDEEWQPNFIGLGYSPHKDPNNVPLTSHSSPRMHWRRGHLRNQPHGPHLSLCKTIWIQPMLINVVKINPSK